MTLEINHQTIASICPRSFAERETSPELLNFKKWNPFVMRIVRKGEKEVTVAAAEKKLPPSDVSKTVQLGFEDLILAIVMIVLVVGYARGQLTIQDFLAYLGSSKT
jgi:hypothetical protein